MPGAKVVAGEAGGTLAQRFAAGIHRTVAAKQAIHAVERACRYRGRLSSMHRNKLESEAVELLVVL
jgi:hypothetical protein